MCREFGLSSITCSLRLQKFSGWRDTFEKIGFVTGRNLLKQIPLIKNYCLDNTTIDRNFLID